MERFDFHTHSDVSDGSLAPAEVVREAAAAGVVAFALTDHDTVDGIAAAQAEGRARGVEVIAGIELSVSEREGARALHVLGLFLDPEHAGLRARLAAAHEARARRGAAIVAKLRESGVAIELAAVQRIAGAGSLGRPHVARALVDAGVCRDADEAFEKWLRRGRPAYVPNSAFSAREAIELVHAAGGVAVLAHPPLSSGVDAPGGLEGFVESLIPLGLDGVEVWHPNHRPGSIKRLRKVARNYGLVETGGSDFHGEDRPDVKLGRGRANGLRVGRDVYEALAARAKSIRTAYPAVPR